MIEDFYKILSREVQAERVVWQVRLLLESTIYKVHFPGMPITPGACQLEIVRLLAERELSMPVEIASVKNIKFLQIVNPLETATVEVSESLARLEDGTVKCSAVIAAGDTIMTKVSFILKKQSF